ncbi:dihydrofolate synthase [Halorhodospira halochloris]|uniref:Dihydrofolate synthase/folylpolyglutamate synthase n=1 Tax=Halorhodospira halochloris TaxID=1052 RepID=A0A0X8X965_HALHR|nr:folylpolyglutamate synthase/dihydrofolate synthase family protein [Halorhodospira halochloris]MBK1652320.1 hypothetical protein [Halorhodospira halochloris]BAU57724.1 dihydrofolate synthase [Halorhodospira halochloris]
MARQVQYNGNTSTPSVALVGGGLPTDLESWLQLLERAHPQEIDLGLERVAAVAQHLSERPGTLVGAADGITSPNAEVVTIAGTNGKGSVAAMVAALAQSAGYRVGLYSSPHFSRFNERVKVAGFEADDETLIGALRRVELARQAAGVSLTYFEHTTLAAFVVFAESDCDLWVLEVGLGGRLDAVNLIDADVAVVTRIAHDHAEWLGNDLASIAREKAGIFRSHKAAVIGQADAPDELSSIAQSLAAEPIWQAGKDYHWSAFSSSEWHWNSGSISLPGLSYPSIPGPAALSNAATALAAFQQLSRAGLISAAEISAALSQVKVIGRLQLLEYSGTQWLYDVAHNADGAAELARVLSSLPRANECHALLAVARHKEAEGLIAATADQVDYWHLPSMDDEQMIAAVELAGHVRNHRGTIASCGADLQSTLAGIERGVRHGGSRVVVFGSFRTVTAVQQQQGWG